MKQVILSLLVLLVISTNVFSQKRDYVKLTYGCHRYSEINNEPFFEDSTLTRFYREVDSFASFNLNGKDTFAYLKSILSKARDRSDEVCFLPFLRIFDKEADTASYYTCLMSSYVVPHKIYCDLRSIRFVVLFAIHFSFADPYDLKKGRRFDDIELRKRDAADKQPLNASDYAAIYQLYTKWIENCSKENALIRRSPLQDSKYEWVVATSPNWTQPRLQQLRRWREPNPPLLKPVSIDSMPIFVTDPTTPVKSKRTRRR